MRKFLLLLCAMLCVVACESGKNPDPDPQPEPTPEESQPAYKVGDLYDVDGVKGLIFRVNDDGKSGLIVSLTEAPTKLAWSTELVVTNATSRKNGAENCEKIMTIADWSSKYPAFVWCKSLGDGWYIPSVNELRELLIISSSNTFRQAIVANKATLFSDGKYLSSTEMDDWWIYLVDAATAQESANYKQYIYRVRAIYQF